MRVLVTGGCGFIGSAVCRRLIADGHTVINVDKLTYAGHLSSVAEISGSDRYAFAQVDIVDAPKMRELFALHRPEAVIHLAAESHVDRSITDAAAFVRTNLTGAYVLLEEALRHRDALPAAEAEAFRFLHVSTDEVYGSLGDTGAFSESTPYDPRSPYSASKAGADHLAAAWAHTFGLPVLISNCSNNYGPYHFPEKLIPLAILNALEGAPVSVYGDGLNVRDWLYVDDHVSALLTILARGRPGEKYNVGARSERTNLTVAQAVCDLVDELASSLPRPRRELIRFVPDRPGHDRRYAIDPSKLETELGWRPAESFESGLKRTVRWYLERRDWWGPLRRTYGGERLGLRR